MGGAVAVQVGGHQVQLVVCTAEHLHQPTGSTSIVEQPREPAGVHGGKGGEGRRALMSGVGRPLFNLIKRRHSNSGCGAALTQGIRILYEPGECQEYSEYSYTY